MTTRAIKSILLALTIWLAACKTKEQQTEIYENVSLSTIATSNRLSSYNVRLFDTIDIWPVGIDGSAGTEQAVRYRTIRHARLDAIEQQQDTIKESLATQSVSQLHTTKDIEKKKRLFQEFKFFYSGIFIVVLLVVALKIRNRKRGTS